MLLASFPALSGAFVAPLAQGPKSFAAPVPSAAARTQALAYTPSPMDTSVLAQQAVVIGLSAGAYAYWSSVIVPQKRTELSKSKRGGEIDEYLAELETEDGAAERPLERWLLSDWVDARSKDGRPRERNKVSAIPILKDAKWNSGDNPVLAAAALILAAGIASSLGERVWNG